MDFLPLTPDDVNNIAMLARLRIDRRDIPAYASNLSRIIEFVNQLNAADTDAVTPMAHPLDKPQRLRVDEVAEEDRRELYQRNAPAVEEALYTVPRVIE
jgi:aspartyl-tRNA(Asn)/glutamyl-tRNA(Gln) amidotransferase subunit C